MSLNKNFREYYSENNVADILGVSKRNIQSRRDDLFAQKNKKNLIHISELSHYPMFKNMMPILKDVPETEDHLDIYD